MKVKAVGQDATGHALRWAWAEARARVNTLWVSVPVGIVAAVLTPASAGGRVVAFLVAVAVAVAALFSFLCVVAGTQQRDQLAGELRELQASVASEGSPEAIVRWEPLEPEQRGSNDLVRGRLVSLLDRACQAQVSVEWRGPAGEKTENNPWPARWTSPPRERQRRIGAQGEETIELIAVRRSDDTGFPVSLESGEIDGSSHMRMQDPLPTLAIRVHLDDLTEELDLALRRASNVRGFLAVVLHRRVV